MTTRNQTQTPNTIHFGELGKGRGWKDLFVVSFLALVLGAFVAQNLHLAPGGRLEPAGRSGGFRGGRARIGSQGGSGPAQGAERPAVRDP